MRRIYSFLFVFLFVGIAFLFSSFSVEEASAASSAVYEGTLIEHPNTGYTHKLKDQNVNLILSENYNSLEENEVKVTVQFTDGGKFIVLSVEKNEATPTPAPIPTPKPETTETTFEGKLVTNPNTGYTHMLEGKNVNLILDGMFKDLVGKIVKVKVRFYVGSKFTILDVQEI